MSAPNMTRTAFVLGALRRELIEEGIGSIQADEIVRIAAIELVEGGICVRTLDEPESSQS